MSNGKYDEERFLNSRILLKILLGPKCKRMIIAFKAGG